MEPGLRSNSSSTIGDIVSRFITVDHLVHDPLSSGFLLKHCKEQFSDENMLFVVAVDRFRDYFHRDYRVWPTGKQCWRELDNEYLTQSPETETLADFMTAFQSADFFPEENWPSKIVHRDAVKEVVAEILYQFIVTDADKWICISGTVLSNTLRRIRNIHIYGRETFSEALLDPFRTIERDIYPRFLASPHHRSLLEAIQTLEKRAYCEKLKLPRPERTVCLERYPKQQLQQNAVVFTLADLIEDGTLFAEFSSYLESCVAEENLKFMRAVAIFKESFQKSPTAKDKKTPLQHAILVYRYFIAPQAPFEVCTSHVQINEILRGLADPTPSLFAPVERIAMGALRSHYQAFSASPQFQNLNKLVLSQSAVRLPPVTMAARSSSKYGRIDEEGTQSGARVGSLATTASLPELRTGLLRGNTVSGAEMQRSSPSLFSSCFPNPR